MSSADSIFLGGAAVPPSLLLRFANRHGLIAGATGTGKTVSLQVLVEGLSAQGVPVFLADVKGDLSGIARPGSASPKLVERAARVGVEPSFEGCPVVFWDVFGEQGHPIRTTVSEMGPVLLSRLLELNDVQEGVLNIAFRVADERGLLLLDLKDLRAMLAQVSGDSAALSAKFGNVAPASAGAIQRQLLVLEQQGAGRFFGEPALAIADIMRCDVEGRGIVNVLVADRLMEHPRTYSTLLLWLLSELFEDLPEVGDVAKPRLVFVFDEAHLLFSDASPALVRKLAQVVRLVRSKGVGAYFVTQNPLDIPEEVLGQLGNRVQHALRAFTLRDQRVVRAVADTFRQNPDFDAATVIGALGTGEALVSVLDERGSPTVVQRTLMRPPMSRMGPLSEAERSTIIARSPVGDRYDAAIDRVSAYEQLSARATALPIRQAMPPPSPNTRLQEPMREADAQGRAPRGAKGAGRGGAGGMASSAFRTFGREIGRQVGRQLIRGVLGSLSR